MHLLEQHSNWDLDALILHAEQDAETRKRRGLVCAACGSLITYEVYKTTISGSHHLRRVNPHGIEYEFSIFSRAPGCANIDPATEKNTWFKGFAWRVAVCGRCAEHLGWHFKSPGGDSFYGLITTRVIPHADD
jgi:hypothetical protein